MPVEIKELVIRITDTSHSAEVGGNAAQSPSLELVVEAAVKQVLKILEKKQKR